MNDGYMVCIVGLDIVYMVFFDVVIVLRVVVFVYDGMWEERFIVCFEIVGGSLSGF